MKKLIVLLLPLFLFPLGVSASVIFNYQSIADHAGDPNHKGEAILEGVPITVSGLTVTAYGSYDGDDDRGWAYLDKSDAGLGVCHQPLGNCASHWDDNLTDNEVLQLVFSESVSLDSLLLQRGNHHGFNERFRLSLNGTDYTQYEYLSDSYLGLTSTNFFFMTSTDTPQDDNDAIYIKSIGVSSASIPEPSIIALFGAGLFGLGLARRRRS